MRRFRNAPVKGGVFDALPAEVCRQIEGRSRRPKRRSRCATGEEGIDIHAGLQSLADKVPADRAETASCARRPAIAGSRASEKRFDRSISKRRFRIGQCFGTMKRLFGPAGTRKHRQAHEPSPDVPAENAAGTAPGRKSRTQEENQPFMQRSFCV